MLKVFLIVLVLFATPAMAEQKLFLSCTNGRDPQTNARVSDPNLSLIVESEAKRLSLNEDSQGFPIDQLDNQKITVIAGKLDAQTAATMKLILDRFGGHLTMEIVLNNCPENQQGMPKGLCATTALYDCSVLW